MAFYCGIEIESREEGEEKRNIVKRILKLMMIFVGLEKEIIFRLKRCRMFEARRQNDRRMNEAEK